MKSSTEEQRRGTSKKKNANFYFFEKERKGKYILIRGKATRINNGAKKKAGRKRDLAEKQMFLFGIKISSFAVDFRMKADDKAVGKLI